MENPSFDEIMSRLKGGITSEEADLLRRLASQVDTGCIVEVGSFRGKSAVALATGVNDRAGARPRIYCIEPHRPFTGFYGGEFGPQDRGAFYQAMLDTGAFNDVALVNLSSEEVTSGWRESVGFVFIDGDHNYEPVKRDFQCWDPHVLPGGLVAFDDAADPACGPFRLIREILRGGGYSKIQMTGKLVVLQKAAGLPRLQATTLVGRKRLLVACDDYVLAGGLLRFDRVGKVLCTWGHEVAFVALAKKRASKVECTLPILSFDEASETRWDAVMAPGAGFKPATIKKFELFKSEQFGVRIQHVLNDQSRRENFMRMNESFAPHVVVFNNNAWPAGSFTEFHAERFHVLPGAVDPVEFRPASYRHHPLQADRWIVGGLANKNPAPLIEALSELPAKVVVRLYGSDDHGLARSASKLIKAGRLELAGVLHGAELSQFYRQVDCIVMTEESAGWANLAAEAMASGVPLVCTPHGTTSFAKHDETAFVIDAPTPSAIAAGVQRLMGDPELCNGLSDAARQTIATFSWESYARELLAMIRRDGQLHYTAAPELGLYGKWPLEERLYGLQPLLEQAEGLSIIDFGAAEGIVAREFLERGAKSVHGFELDAHRVNFANAMLADREGTVFRCADLSTWDGFMTAHSDSIADQYDVVLYLGIQHHLPVEHRIETLQAAMRLAKRFIAIRTTKAVYESDRIPSILGAAGFNSLTVGEDPTPDGLGIAMIFERNA